MNWKHYKAQLTKDLERWIEVGWVPADAKESILDDVEARTPQADISPWLALTGVVLGGVALIALVADNWAVIPRLAKLILLLGLFWAALGGALWADAQKRARTVNGFVLLAGLIFAASLGLLGQSLNMSGDPADTLLFGGLGAFALSLASRSSGAGVLGAALSSIWFVNVTPGFLGLGGPDVLHRTDLIGFGLLLMTGATAAACRCRILLHGLLAIGGLYFLSVLTRLAGLSGGAMLAAGLWAAVGLVAALASQQSRVGALTALGWSAWHFNFAVAASGIDFDDAIGHRVIWLAFAIATLAGGVQFRSGWAAAAGILSLITAGFVLLMDLGLALTTAALIFGIAAAGAGALAWFLRRPQKEQG